MTTNNLMATKKMSLIGLLAVLGTLFIISCSEDDTFEARPVTFKIDASATSITVNETVDYADASVNVTSRAWTFEGGSIPSSTDQAVSVTYPEDGRFETRLKVTFQDGTEDDRLFYTNVSPEVISEFSADRTTLVVGNDVTFTNLTEHIDVNTNRRPDDINADEELETFIWEFEGGEPATSTEQNPVVRYQSTGTFKVKLTSNRNYPKFSASEEKVSYIQVVDVAVISPLAVKLCSFGSQINLTYEESLNAPTAESTALYDVLVNDASSAIASMELDPNDDKTLIIKMTSPIQDGDNIKLNFAGNIFAGGGSLLAGLNDLNVENTVVSLFPGNMGFDEGGAGEFPPNWGTWNPTQSKNNNEFYQAIDSDIVSGSNALQISYDGSGDTWIFENQSPADVIPGESYRVSFWAKASVEGAPLDIRVIEQGWAAANNPADVSLSTEWEQYTFDFVANDAQLRYNTITTIYKGPDSTMSSGLLYLLLNQKT